ncbi:fumarylacetoacetate hydrolase family protein [Nibricoccus sp. IMCC34717]|uniref:fumarylacetoacetate hydrolase family protein n=1 Tax=Nibricoccus sp. IMCC34717 TaxID=3034021 RepID=UPI0038516215
MKIVRVEAKDGRRCFGVPLDSGRVRLLLEDPLSTFPRLPELSDEVVDGARLLAPVEPRCIIGIGLNYRHHAVESGLPIPGHPVVFFKNPASVQNPGAPIFLPSRLPSTEVDYEAELAVVIGRTCRNVTKANALSHVAGYTAANDVSARDWQRQWGGSQWCRGKSFDTFCPLGPTLVTPDELKDPSALKLRSLVNGEVRQDWHTSDMIFDVPALIEFLSGDTTLEAGTVILTGTPHGVGMGFKPPRYLVAGDVVEISIDGVGSLVNPVRMEPSGS